MDWLVPIISAIAAILTLFLSKPERRSLAIIAAIIILIPAAWQGYNEYKVQQVERQREIHIIRKLSSQTDRFLDLISDMIFSASDGWLPKNEEEFFSKRTAELLCRELNIDKPALWNSEISWRQLIAKKSQDYEKSLREVLNESCGALDADLVQRVSSVAPPNGQSGLIFFMMGAPSIESWDIRHNVERAPLLCWGGESFVDKSLADIKALYEEIREEEEELDILTSREWLVFARTNYPNLLGKDRFSPDDLKQWLVSHPSDPGPSLSGAGNPNKTGEFNPHR